MKRLFYLFVCIGLVFGLSGCKYAQVNTDPTKVQADTLYSDNGLRILGGDWKLLDRFMKNLNSNIQFFSEQEEIYQVSGLVDMWIQLNKNDRKAFFVMVDEQNSNSAAFYSINIYPASGVQILFLSSGALTLHLRQADGNIVQAKDCGILFFPQQNYSQTMDTARQRVLFRQNFNKGKRPNLAIVRLKPQYKGLEVLKVTINSQYVKFPNPQLVTKTP